MIGRLEGTEGVNETVNRNKSSLGEVVDKKGQMGGFRLWFTLLAGRRDQCMRNDINTMTFL